MKLRSFLYVIIAFLSLQFNAVAQPIAFENAFPNLTFAKPVFFNSANDGTNRVFVVEQAGLIKSFLNDSSVSTVTNFLSIGNKVDATSNEMGLLGLAFHPNFVGNQYFYVNYTAASPRRTVIARYNTLAGNPFLADTGSAQILLEIAQPFTNHNGGNMMFGTDGYLYIGMGDGGSGGDPNNNGQNKQSLLGKILRIDVDNPGGGNNYGIPNDNPFVGQPAQGLPEIFAWGIRNPWRFSQDAQSGLIYLGDVGQGNWEEVSVIENGNNYGWRITEGFACYNPSTNCDTTGITMPIKVYANAGSECSITGGYVYRGIRRPELEGRYIYGDYCSGKIWKLLYNNGVVSDEALLLDASWYLISFGQDQNNELHMVSRNTANNNGNIFRFNRVINVDVPEINAQVLVNPRVVHTTSGVPQMWFSLLNEANIQIELLDMNGKVLGVSNLPTLQSGEFKISMPYEKDNLKSGFYVARLSWKDQKTTGTTALKFVVY